MLSTVMIVFGLAGLVGVAVRRMLLSNSDPIDPAAAQMYQQQADANSIYTLANIIPMRYGHGVHLINPPTDQQNNQQ
jgi:FlaG/FlaF family flagellin (archaellin)